MQERMLQSGEYLRRNRTGSFTVEKRRDEKINEERRDVVKNIAAASAGILVGGSATSLLLDKITSETETSERSPETPQETPYENSPTQQQEEIHQSNADTIGRTFEEQLRSGDHITIDASTRRAIYEKWKHEYSPKPEGFRGADNFEHGLLPGLKRMQPWLDQMKEEFRALGVPEDLVYLSIPESHFLLDAVSPAGATGPFQFMEYTAKLSKLKLRMESNYDERRDPIRSARACAKHLQLSYKMMGDNWDLALADYNGGFTNGFMRHLIQQRKTQKFEMRSQTHAVRSGDNFSRIAHDYSVPLTWLLRANNLSSTDTIYPGDILKLPKEQDDQVSKEAYYDWIENKINTELQRIEDKSKGSSKETLIQRKKRALQKFSENLNYPEKFFAILNVIRDHELKDAYPSTKPSFGEVETAQFQKALKTKNITLARISNRYSIDLQRLVELNPAILHPNKDIPSTALVRIPR